MLFGATLRDERDGVNVSHCGQHVVIILVKGTNESGHITGSAFKTIPSLKERKKEFFVSKYSRISLSIKYISVFQSIRLTFGLVDFEKGYKYLIGEKNAGGK